MPWWTSRSLSPDLSHHVELWRVARHRAPVRRVRDALRLAGVHGVEIPARTSWSWGERKSVQLRRETSKSCTSGVFSPLNDSAARTLRVPYVFSPHGGYSSAVLAHHR